MTRSGRIGSSHVRSSDVGPSHVVMLTRYPAPGEVKSRLIPALGRQGAADLHAELTRYCLSRIAPVSATREATLEVRHDGGNGRQMRAWLGRRQLYRPQPAGDLGERLRACVEDAFERGAERVVVVGSDCPALGAPQVRGALAALGAPGAPKARQADTADTADVALVPANDGGYALIALARETATDSVLRALFGNIAWGTDSVLATTLERARACGLAVHLGESLADIDRPEDVGLWESLLAEEHRIPLEGGVSVIVPTLDEEDNVARAVGSAFGGGALEVVVADANSTDETCARARSAGARVVRVRADRAGRAAQMNAGAAQASGDILVFLHADTRLPPDSASLVRSALSRPGVIAGAFDFAVLEPRGMRDRLAATVGRMRARLTHFPYGDQAIFLRASAFADLGGFPELPVMEDWEFVWRLRRLGRMFIVPEGAPTSSRSWDERGLLFATFVNVSVIVGYVLGVDPHRLARWRERIAARSGSGTAATYPNTGQEPTVHVTSPLWEESGQANR